MYRPLCCSIELKISIHTNYLSDPSPLEKDFCKKDKKMQEKERMEIIREIYLTKTVQEQEEVISESISTAFEKGRITEAEYYYLLLQYQIISKLQDIEISIGQS